MKTLETIHHKKNEIQEVKFYKDKECTEDFDFTNAKNLYIQLVNGDVTPFFYLNEVSESFRDNIKLFINGTLPKIQNIRSFIGLDLLSKYRTRNIQKYVLDNSFYGGFYNIQNITPNLSKYIPEDNAVLFLSEEGCKKYSPIKKYDYNQKGNFSNPENVNDVWLTTFDSEYNTLIAKIGVGLYDVEDDCLYKRCPESGNRIYFKKLTIFLPHGTQSELQKANEVAKELKEKYGVEEVNLFVLHCFTQQDYILNIYGNCLEDSCLAEDVCNFNKIITTNSTGILKPENSTERLQIIDAKEIFEEYLNRNN